MNITNALDFYPGGIQVHFIRTTTTLVACLTIHVRRNRGLGRLVCRDIRTQELTDCYYVKQLNTEMRILYLCLFNEAVEFVRQSNGGSELLIRGLRGGGE